MKLWFRIFLKGILPAFLILLILEIILRSFYPTLLREPSHPPFQRIEPLSTNILNSNPDYCIIGSRKQIVCRKKRDKNQMRIVVLGGSVVYGSGVPYYMAFPELLEKILQRAYPDRPVEVINGGMGGADSTQIASLAGIVMKDLSPDAVIIMSGNNDFLSLMAYRIVYPGYNGYIEEIRAALDRLAVYRLFKKCFQRPERKLHVTDIVYNPDRFKNNLKSKKELSQKMIYNPTLCQLWDKNLIGDAEKRVIKKIYAENMEKISRASKETGTGLLLCTVPINLKYYSNISAFNNFEILHNQNIKKPILRKTLKQAKKFYNSGEEKKAAKTLENYLARDQDGVAAFLLGNIKLELGESESALDLLQLAAELDTNPSRALPSFGAIIKETGKKFNVPVVDLVKIIKDNSPQNIPGYNYFLDQVHLNLPGNRLAADTIANRLIDSKLFPPGKISVREAEESADAFFSDIYDIRSWKGPREYVNSNMKEAESLFPGISSMRWIDNINIENRVNHFLKMVPLSDRSPLRQVITGHELFLAGHYQEAIERYRIALKLAPDQDRLLISIAEALLFAQDLEGAKEAFKKYAEKQPGDPEILLKKAVLGF